MVLSHDLTLSSSAEWHNWNSYGGLNSHHHINTITIPCDELIENRCWGDMLEWREVCWKAARLILVASRWETSAHTTATFKTKRYAANYCYEQVYTTGTLLYASTCCWPYLERGVSIVAHGQQATSSNTTLQTWESYEILLPNQCYTPLLWKHGEWYGPSSILWWYVLLTHLALCNVRASRTPLRQNGRTYNWRHCPICYPYPRVQHI